MDLVRGAIRLLSYSLDSDIDLVLSEGMCKELDLVSVEVPHWSQSGHLWYALLFGSGSSKVFTSGFGGSGFGSELTGGSVIASDGCSLLDAGRDLASLVLDHGWPKSLIFCNCFVLVAS